MQAYRDFQARVSADPQREAMRQTLQQSNSPFALLGRGVGNVANASLPPTADMLRAQIQSNPDTANPSMPETIGNTIDFFQNMSRGVTNNDPFAGAPTGEVQGIAQREVAPEVIEFGQKAASYFNPNYVPPDVPFVEDEDPYGLDGDEAVVSTPPIVDKSMSTADIDAEGGTGERDKNWFDALESRVDLMAMGAAMLANAGSGRGTFENLGVALQAGLGAKKASSKAEQDKAYKDKLMALEVLKLQNVDNRFKNYTSKISDLAASLEGKGVPSDESKGIASTIFAETEGAFVNYDSNTKSNLLDSLIDNTTSWYDVGKPDVDRTKIRSVLADISQGKL